MTDKVTINRLHTGVPGLDEVLGGGLPEFSFNIIAGPPGSGKTTLAHQMMFALAKPDRPALYFTVLGEPPLKMLRYQQQFEFFDEAAVNHSIHFVNLADDAASGDLGKVLERIVVAVERYAPGVVLIDSFRSVALAGQNGSNPFLGLQAFVQQLGMLMTSWQATTFLIGEYWDEQDPNPVFTVADGLIWLRHGTGRNSTVRKIEIMKMRGQASLSGRHTLRISPSGIRIFPPPAQVVGVPPQKLAPPTGDRLHMGVPELDAMLGGGLPRGYSLLVAGPSGSGKSKLAAAFLAEGARSGETGVIASFEQRPKLSRDRGISELIDSGNLALVPVPESELSVNEITNLLVDEIRRVKATRVVLDSLSGFELMVAPDFREDFRQSVYHLVRALATSGVSVLMTTELEDRYDDLRFSPYGAAFLTDAIIVQRYIEVDSQLLRVMAVVKVRASAHSNELRQFVIDDDGIRIGTALTEFEGLLGGRPKRHGDGSGTGGAK